MIFLTDNFTAIISVVAILVSLITFFWGFSKNKKLNSETEWCKVWATHFLERSNEFNELASKIVVGITLVHGQKKYDDQVEVKKRKEEEIKNFLDQLSFYEWELKKYGQFAPKEGKEFDKAASELFNSLSELINYARNPAEHHSFNLEKIRKIQFEYSKKSRDVHAELLGL